MTLDVSKPGHARALARLRAEKIAWLTTVTPDGQPQTMPVWFLWVEGGDGSDELLVYGDRRARRNRNLEANDRVTIHLDEDDDGGAVVIEGRAVVDPDHPQVYDNPAYLAKYGDSIERSLGGAHRMAETYDVPIRIRPTRVIAFEG